MRNQPWIRAVKKTGKQLYQAILGGISGRESHPAYLIKVFAATYKVHEVLISLQINK